MQSEYYEWPMLDGIRYKSWKSVTKVLLHSQDLLPYIEEDTDATIASKTVGIDALEKSKEEGKSLGSCESIMAKPALKKPTIESLLGGAKSMEEWTRNQRRENGKAMFLIVQSVDASLLYLICELESTFKKWEML